MYLEYFGLADKPFRKTPDPQYLYLSRGHSEALARLGPARSCSAGKRPVLIIDEAHLIPSAEVFEEIRLLTNFQLDQKNLIPIILMGQPSLRQRLRHSTYRPLIQRIGLYYNIEPLSTEETMAYIRHRLKLAGATHDLFSEEALLSIYRLSRGIPRLVNTLCETALLIAFGKREKGVNEGIIKAVARDFKWLLEEESR